LPDIRRRCREASAEKGEIIEPHINRHRADVAIGKAQVAQDPLVWMKRSRLVSEGKE